MATLRQLLDIIPDTDEFRFLEFTLQRIASDFEDQMQEITPARVERWVTEISSGNRTDDDLRRDIFHYIVTEDVIAERYGVSKEQARAAIEGETSIAELARAAPDVGGTRQVTVDQPGVMPGGETVRVGDEWFQTYEFPPGSGEFMVFQFNNREQVEATFGDIPEFRNRSQTWLDERGIVQGAAEEVIGETVSFQRFTTEIMTDAAAAAGIRDPSLVGRIASNPEMQQIMAQAIAGDWTPQQVLAEQRQTEFWKTELYPGIEKFYSMTDNPEGAYREYQATVEPALARLGYERGADGTFKGEIGRMLENEIDAGTFIQQVPTFIRATQNAEFAGVLNQWAEAELGRSVDFNDWFDLMAGESAPELDEVAERAMLAYEAQNRGTDVSDDQIRQLAERSQLSQQEAIAAFSNFNQAVLATEGFRRSELSQEDVLSAMAGINPSSGRSIDEVRLEVAKLAREEALLDDDKINFYVGFDEQGRPTRPGLQSLAPESA